MNRRWILLCSFILLIKTSCLLSEIEPIDFNKEKVSVLIMAGGNASRYFYNKIFADPIATGKVMLRQAFDRLVAEDPSAFYYEQFLDSNQLYIAAAPAFEDAVTKYLPQLPKENLFTDPAKKGTWPAILWSMAHISQKNPSHTLVILTSDHIIDDLDIFRKTLAKACAIAEQESAIITIGIHPSDDLSQWEAFGMLHTQEPALEKQFQGVFTCSAFHEKPKKEEAAFLLQENKKADKDIWSWNSGMFIARCDVYEQALKTYRPDMYDTYLRMKQSIAQKDIKKAKQIFSEFKQKIPRYNKMTKQVNPHILVDNSIDFAIMEQLTDDPSSSLSTYTIPADFFWMDIGSLGMIFHVKGIQKDAQGNIVVGSVITDSTVKDSYLWAQEGKKISAKNIKNMIVVYGNDGTVIIVPRNHDQKVKELTETFYDIRLADPSILRARFAHLINKQDQLTFRDTHRRLCLQNQTLPEILQELQNHTLSLETLFLSSKNLFLSIPGEIPGQVRIMGYGLSEVHITAEEDLLTIIGS